MGDLWEEMLIFFLFFQKNGEMCQKCLRSIENVQESVKNPYGISLYIM